MRIQKKKRNFTGLVYIYIVYHFSQGQCLGLIFVGGLERGGGVGRSGFLSSAIIWKGSNWWYALVMVSWLLLYTAINHKTAIQILDHICWKKNVDRYDSPSKSCPVLHEKKNKWFTFLKCIFFISVKHDSCQLWILHISAQCWTSISKVKITHSHSKQ